MGWLPGRVATAATPAHRLDPRAGHFSLRDQDRLSPPNIVEQSAEAVLSFGYGSSFHKAIIAFSMSTVNTGAHWGSW